MPNPRLFDIVSKACGWFYACPFIEVTADSSLEITLHPTKSKHPIELEISVNNETIHKLPTIDSGKLLGWDIETYPW